MTAVLVSVAEAVRSEIESELEGEFAAWPIDVLDRGYADFQLELREVTPLRVDVVGVAYAATEKETRGSLLYDVDVLICVRQKFAPEDRNPDGRLTNDAVDNLVALVQKIHDYFCVAEELTDYSSAEWRETKIVVPYSREHLARHQFTGIVRVQYRAAVDL